MFDSPPEKEDSKSERDKIGCKFDLLIGTGRLLNIRPEYVWWRKRCVLSALARVLAMLASADTGEYGSQ